LKDIDDQLPESAFTSHDDDEGNKGHQKSTTSSTKSKDLKGDLNTNKIFSKNIIFILSFIACMTLSYYLPVKLVDNYANIPGGSGIIRVIFSPKNEGLITFEVELNGINVDDGFGKEIYINW